MPLKAARILQLLIALTTLDFLRAVCFSYVYYHLVP